MNMTSSFKLGMVAGILSLVIGAAPTLANSIDCDIQDATANGSYADACDFVDGGIASSGDHQAHVDSTWGDGFTYIGKFQKDDGVESGDLAGFTLLVTEGPGADEFSYSLEVPDEWIGKVVDWVFEVKQANDSVVSYFFEGVTLGIDGMFNSFWINKAGNQVVDYSHVAGFIRPSVTVPEPGTLGLLGIGVLTLTLSQRRKKA